MSHVYIYMCVCVCVCGVTVIVLVNGIDELSSNPRKDCFTSRQCSWERHESISFPQPVMGKS